MPSSRSHITSLTGDYDAIEHAIRETSRGRWFLACYLERNRSSETRMLLGAISKLESAMRDGGKLVKDTAAIGTIATLREAMNQARSDMAHLPMADRAVTELPLTRFDFEHVPAALAEEVQRIHDAAESIHSTAYAMQAAGIFQDVAEQISESADAIERSCTAHETILARAARMASLLSEIEAELMSAFEDETDAMFQFGNGGGQIHGFTGTYRHDRTISDELVEEISVALSDYADEDNYRGPSKA